MVLIEVDGELLERCDNCGAIWDGYAQCPCWYNGWWPAEAEEDNDSGYDTDEHA
jgi:hypothetical protein